MLVWAVERQKKNVERESSDLKIQARQGAEKISLACIISLHAKLPSLGNCGVLCHNPALDQGLSCDSFKEVWSSANRSSSRD